MLLKLSAISQNTLFCFCYFFLKQLQWQLNWDLLPCNVTKAMFSFLSIHFSGSRLSLKLFDIYVQNETVYIKATLFVDSIHIFLGGADIHFNFGALNFLITRCTSSWQIQQDIKLFSHFHRKNVTRKTHFLNHFVAQKTLFCRNTTRATKTWILKKILQEIFTRCSAQRAAQNKTEL